MCLSIRVALVVLSVPYILSAQHEDRITRRQLDFGDGDLLPADSAVVKIELKTEDAERIKDGKVEEIKITRKIPVPVPVKVEKRVPVAVPVPVDQPFPVYIHKPVPYAVHKPVPVPVKVPLSKPFITDHKMPQPLPKLPPQLPKVPQIPHPLPHPHPHPHLKLPLPPLLSAHPFINTPLGLLRNLVNNIKMKLHPLAHVKNLPHLLHHHHHPPPKPVVKHVPVPYPVEKVVPVPVEVPVPVKVKEYVPFTFHSTSSPIKHTSEWPDHKFTHFGNNFLFNNQHETPTSTPNYHIPHSFTTEQSKQNINNPFEFNKDVAKIQHFYKNLFNYPSQLSHQKYSLSEMKFPSLKNNKENDVHSPVVHQSSEPASPGFSHDFTSSSPFHHQESYHFDSRNPNQESSTPANNYFPPSQAPKVSNIFEQSHYQPNNFRESVQDQREQHSQYPSHTPYPETFFNHYDFSTPRDVNSSPQTFDSTPSFDIEYIESPTPKSTTPLIYPNVTYSSYEQEEVTNNPHGSFYRDETTKYQSGFVPSQPPHYTRQFPTYHYQVNEYNEQEPQTSTNRYPAEQFHYNFFIPMPERKEPLHETIHYGKPKNVEYTTKHVNPDELHYHVYLPVADQIEPYRPIDKNKIHHHNENYSRNENRDSYPSSQDADSHNQDDSNFDYLESFVTEPSMLSDSSVIFTSVRQKNDSPVQGPPREQKHVPEHGPGIDPFQYVRYAPAVKPVAEHSFVYSVTTKPPVPASTDKPFSLEDYLAALSFAKALPPSAPGKSNLIVLASSTNSSSFTNGHK